MAERDQLDLDAVIERSQNRDLHQLDPHAREDIHDRRSLRQLKEKYANRFLWFLAVQLLVMNLVFICTGVGWLYFKQ